MSIIDESNVNLPDDTNNSLGKIILGEIKWIVEPRLLIQRINSGDIIFEEVIQYLEDYILLLNPKQHYY